MDAQSERVSGWKRELSAVLDPSRVLASEAETRAYDCDAYGVERSRPMVVVLPENTAEVQALVRWCAAHGVPFTARGAGTGLSGGAMAALGGVLISTKRMTSILRVDVPNRCLLAQAGAVNKRISDTVREFGLHFAPDPSSQSVSTIGGNIAENSGGPHTLKYGVTVQHILGVTLVLPDGEVAQIGGPLGLPPGMDLLGLIVGSEGTLGLVTEAWLKLTPLPTAVMTAVATFPSIRQATETVAAIIASGTIPAALEMMDRNILVAVHAAFGLAYPPETEAMLLVECDADGTGAEAGERVRHDMETVQHIFHQHGCLSVEMAEDEAHRLKLWTARKKAVGAMGRLAPSIVTHDGVIPRSKLPEMLDTVYEVACRHGLNVANMFHAGDGNLHPCFYFDDREPGIIDRVVEAGETIIRRCIELGGSVTGEHGIGVEKIDLLGLMFSEDDLRLQADMKRIFHESLLCNPCKVLPNQKGCTEHKKRWRGVAW